MTTRGDRLRAYLLSKTGGRSGWQRDLVRASGVKRQTISKWTAATFDGYPDPEALAAVAAALGVRPFEVVAAIDGDVALSLEDPRVEETLRRLIDGVLDERLVPPREDGGRAGAA